MARALLLWICLLGLQLGLHAQGIASAQPNTPLNKKFTSAVDQLDEFVDRFNHKDPMFSEAFPHRPKRPEAAERAFLVKTLINPKSKLDPKTVAGFITTLTNSAQPAVLNFGDDDWYATLTCNMLLDGKPVQGKVIMRFEVDNNGFSAWRIQSAAAPWLAAEAANLASVRRARRMGLNPASHGNGFISMHRAFMSPESFADNLADSASADARHLTALVKTNRLKLDNITLVQYHFLQVSGYLFTVVDVYAPEGEPSGFLITRLLKASPDAKRRYRRKVLHLQG